MLAMGFAKSSGNNAKCRKQKSSFQDITNCGLEKETCVANQTLRDRSCLVSCDGLYADISDLYQSVESLKQNVLTGLWSLSVQDDFFPNFVRFPENVARIWARWRTSQRLPRILCEKHRYQGDHGSYHLLWILGLQELGQGNKRVEPIFQQMFPTFFASEKFDDGLLLSNTYNNYKKNYVKHLTFNPEEEDSSKVVKSSV